MKKKVGQPLKYGEKCGQFNVRIPASKKAIITRLAKREGVSQADIIVQMIDYCEKMGFM